jgi:hypothetical protein
MGLEQIRRDGVYEPAEQGMIQPTNQIAVAGSEAVERTVSHDHSAINATRLIGLLGEYADGEVQCRIQPGRVISGRRGDGCAPGGCRAIERVKDWCAGASRFRNGLGHDVASQLVVSGWKSNSELAATSAVALGGAPGTWPSATGQPDIVGLEQTFCLQTVEVKLRFVAGNANRCCRLIAGNGLSLGTHEAIQLAAYGVGQRTDTCHILVEALHLVPSITDRCIDDKPLRV